MPDNPLSIPQDQVTPPMPDSPEGKLLVFLQAGAGLEAIWDEYRKEANDFPTFLQHLDQALKHFVHTDAQADPASERGKAIIRLNDLYYRSYKVQDFKTSLAAQRELNKLLSLTRMKPTHDGTIPIDEVRQTWNTVLKALETRVLAVADAAPKLIRKRKPDTLKAELYRRLADAFAEALGAFTNAED